MLSHFIDSTGGISHEFPPKHFPEAVVEFSLFVGSLQRWDPSLKVLAEGYATKCIYAHNPDLEDTGENLFVSTGPLDLRDAVEKWFLGKCGGKVISLLLFSSGLGGDQTWCSQETDVWTSNTTPADLHESAGHWRGDQRCTDE